MTVNTLCPSPRPALFRRPTIDGASQTTINGANMFEVLDVSLGATLHLKNLTVTKGRRGISNSGGTLTISNSTLSENSTADPFGGGGIANIGGTVTITNSTLSGNSSSTDGGGIVNDQGGDITITNSTLSGNSAGSGGGIANFFQGATVTIINSTLSGNSATASGGILNDSGSVTITNSIVANSPSGANCENANLFSFTVNGNNRLTYSEYFNNAVLTSTPIVANTWWVTTMMDVGTYRKEFSGAWTNGTAYSMGAGTECAMQIAADLRSWTLANGTQLGERRYKTP